MTLNIEEIKEIFKKNNFFWMETSLPYYFTFIANSEEEAKEMTEEIVVDGKNYKQDIESAKLTEEEKNVFRRMTELKKKNITIFEKSELHILMNKFIRIKIAHATASDEEVNDFIKKEKGSRGKIQLTKKEVENGVKEMARLKQSLNRFYFVTSLKKDKNNKNIVKVLSINEGQIELKEIKETELNKICDRNCLFYYFNEKELIDKPVKETYNINYELFFSIINDINTNGNESTYLRKNGNGISMAYTILKYCFEKNIIKMSGEYTEGGFVSYIYEKNINIDNDAFIKILCEVGDAEAVKFLIDNNCDIQKYEEEIFFSGSPETIHLFECYCKVTSKALEGACKAVNDNNVGVIKYLLSNYDWKYIDLIKAYNSIKDPRMAEPIFEAIKLKIENKEEIKELIEEKDKNEKTVLHYAAENGNLEIVKLILENLSEQERKELIKEIDEEQKTVLHYAAKDGNLEIFKLLLENFSEQEKKELIEEIDENWETALYYAVGSRNLEIVKLILENYNEQEKKELMEEKDVYGQTIFHYTARYGNLEIINLLFEGLNSQEKKYVIEEKDGEGDTVIYCACGNNPEIYNFLQNIEKNITIEDNNKPTEEEYNNIIAVNDNLEKNEDLEMFDKTSKSIDEIDDEQQNIEVSVERSNG